MSLERNIRLYSSMHYCLYRDKKCSKQHLQMFKHLIKQHFFGSCFLFPSLLKLREEFCLFTSRSARKAMSLRYVLFTLCLRMLNDRWSLFSHNKQHFWNILRCRESLIKFKSFFEEIQKIHQRYDNNLQFNKYKTDDIYDSSFCTYIIETTGNNLDSPFFLKKRNKRFLEQSRKTRVRRKATLWLPCAKYRHENFTRRCSLGHYQHFFFLGRNLEFYYTIRNSNPHTKFTWYSLLFLKLPLMFSLFKDKDIYLKLNISQIKNKCLCVTNLA